MESTSILITGVGGMGIGGGIFRALKNSSLKNRYKIFCSDCFPFSVPLYQTPGFLLPPASPEMADKYFKVLKRKINKFNIKAIIPGSIPEIRLFNDNRDFFVEEDVKLIMNEQNLIFNGDDKAETYKIFKKNSIYTPKTMKLSEVNDIDDVNIPSIIKPRRGFGSREIMNIESKKDFKECMSKCEDKNRFIIQDKIQDYDHEVTIGVVTSKRYEVLGTILMKRKLFHGFTIWGEFFHDDKLANYASEVALKLCSEGPLNIQGFTVDDKLIIFEINPRFSSTTPFRHLAGFDEVSGILDNYLWGTTKKLEYKDCIGIRSLKENIIPLESFKRIISEKNTS